MVVEQMQTKNLQKRNKKTLKNRCNFFFYKIENKKKESKTHKG